jgi:Protein of unknown function (DUF2855)
MKSTALEVHRTSITETRLVDDELGDLGADSVRLKVERFSITANTVTYAEFGDMLDYWGFYPTGDTAWGRVPAMGWAEVVESTHAGVEVGTHYYGWFPMAQYIDLKVAVTATGLRDDGPHRVAHAPVYRTVERTDLDPLHPSQATAPPSDIADAEDRHALVRGLFLTGYLANGFLDANEWFGADHVVVLSASSKTAIGFADCAARHDGLTVVGVTSPGNADFVSGLDIYDSVVTYDDVAASVPDDASGAVVVDMAGNGPTLNALHEALGDRIAYSMVVGRTHHDAPPAAPTSGPTPQMFFAPTALVEIGSKGIDVEAFQAAMTGALHGFVDRSSTWLTIEHRNGPDAAAETWRQVHDGHIPPSSGRIVSLHS